MAFFALLKRYRLKLSLAFFCVAAANLCALVFPWSVKILLDEVLAAGNAALLGRLLALLAVSIAFKAGFEYAGSQLGARTAERAAADLQEKMYRHLLNLSVVDAEDLSSGEIVARLLGDADCVTRFLLSGFLDFFYSALSAVFVLGVLFVMDAKLALFSAAAMSLFLAVYGRTGTRLKESYSRLRRYHADLSAHAAGTFRGLRTVHAFARSEYETGKFLAKQKESLSAAFEAHAGDGRFWVTAQFVSSMGLVVLLGYGAGRVAHGQMSVGTLMAFYAYLGLLFFPLLKMTAAGAVYREARVSLDRVRDFLGRPPSPEENVQDVFERPVRGRVKFEGVSYAYPDGRRAVSDVDLEVQPGEWVAVTGPSGCGKTTLACLVARLFDPVSGRILVDGKDIRDLSLAEYRREAVVLHQNDFLFSDTVLNNIRYGDLRAGDEAVVRASRLAGIHEFIDALPKKYDTAVGEGGVKLSGGQRQRVSLARAILRDPAVLVLDEALSAVDAKSADEIMGSVKKFRMGKTTFVIAHRTFMAQDAERTLVMDAGKLEERTSPVVQTHVV